MASIPEYKVEQLFIERLKSIGYQYVELRNYSDVLANLRMQLIEVLASQAEQERLTIRKRQAEGIAIAKAEGKYKGRQPRKIDEALFNILYNDFLMRKISKTELAKKLNMTRPTLDRILKKRDLMKKNADGKMEYFPIQNKSSETK